MTIPIYDDAWKQHLDLMDKFSRQWDVRKDIHVTALAWDRCVQLGLAYTPHDYTDEFEMQRWHTTNRNVSTMRELAACIIAACDFVDESNPIWANHSGHNDFLSASQILSQSDNGD